MHVKTEDSKLQVLERLLNGARAEADELREKAERYEKIIVSTRLIMGHEMKKPATAIAGYLELVAEDIEKSGDAATLDFIDKAAEECALLNDLNSYFIELLKVESDTDVVGSEPVDVRELLREVIAYVKRSDATDREVTLNVELPDAGFRIDATALKLVSMNLVENALRYSRVKSPVRVEVEKGFDRRGRSDRPLLKMRVVDEGVGIPEEYLTRVFEPFVRLHRDVAEGSGLGLTLVRSLVELNGGEVSIQSRTGQGTTVYVTLPLAVDGKHGTVIHL